MSDSAPWLTDPIWLHEQKVAKLLGVKIEFSCGKAAYYGGRDYEWVADLLVDGKSVSCVCAPTINTCRADSLQCAIEKGALPDIAQLRAHIALLRAWIGCDGDKPNLYARDDELKFDESRFDVPGQPKIKLHAELSVESKE